jgi:hypothetical protein
MVCNFGFVFDLTDVHALFGLQEPITQSSKQLGNLLSLSASINEFMLCGTIKFEKGPGSVE